MQEELRQIDTAPIDALLGIQAEQDQLKGLVAKAEETKGKVSEAVYRRVRKDYDSRLEALEARARPLRDKAREEQGRLRPVHERLRQALEDARLDVEELKFRREVGELKEEEFTSRRSALDEALAQKDVSVVGVLPPPAAVLEPEAPTAPRMKVPVVPPPVPPSPGPEAASAPAAGPGPRGDETLFARAATPPTAEMPIPTEVAVGGSTVVMTFATLVATEGDPPQQYRLGPRTSIGRVQDNEICVPTPSISRKHAVIALTPDGYVLTDLESGNGTFVNDQRIKMSKLKDGDRIRLGNRDFVFRGPGAA